MSRAQHNRPGWWRCRWQVKNLDEKIYGTGRIGQPVIKHTDRLRFGNARQKCAAGLRTLIEIL
jgi:hypothetical protein